MASGITVLECREQILENCRFFSPEDADLNIITTREPLGTCKVIVLRSESNEREALLSESADTFQKAFELLHVKSADAVQNYISTNGFEFVSSKKVDDDEDSDDNSSIVSSDTSVVSSTVALSEVESAYEIDDNRDGPGRRPSHHDLQRMGNPPPGSRFLPAEEMKRRAAMAAATVYSHPRSRLVADGPESSAAPAGWNPAHTQHQHQSQLPPRRRLNPARFVHPPAQMRAGGLPPPLPQSSWRPTANAGAPRPPPPAGQGGMRFPVSSLPPAGPMPNSNRPPSSSSPIPSPGPISMPTPPSSSPSQTTSPPPMSPLLDYRLTIKWTNHGEQRILVNARPTRSEVQEAALRFVRNNPAAFGPNNNSPDVFTLGHRHAMTTLKATVKNAVFGNDSYDLSTYTDEDFSRLCHFSGQFPLFEVVVDSCAPSPPPMMGPI